MTFAEIDDDFDFEWNSWKFMPETLECKLTCDEGMIRLMVDAESLEGLVSMGLNDDFHHEESWQGNFKTLAEAKTWCIDKAKAIAREYNIKMNI